MNYGAIKNVDIADGPGVRVSLFVSGCLNHCPGCFQPQTWDFGFGEPFTKATEDELIALLKPDYIQGITVLGGEPFEPENQRALLPFLKRVREECPGKDVWCFSGCVYDTELLAESRVRCEVTDELLNQIDVLVDGRFVNALKNLNLVYRGSENQRLIDLNKTRETGNIVLWEPKKI